MKHSIVAWDSSYRYFYHLIDGLANQAYPQNEFELIYVEQRPKEFYQNQSRSATTEHPKVKTLLERQDETDIDLKVLFRGDAPEKPFHIGRTVNVGLDAAEGEYISIMDGDQLLPENYLAKLDEFHEGTDTIANVIRRDVPEPLDVDRRNWMDQTVDYQRGLEASPNSGDPIPETTTDYGPMISTHRENWEEIDGYGEHEIWSTGISKLGTDATKRLQVLTGSTAKTLPETVTVHPWHAPGLNRGFLRFRRLFDIQQKLIDWAVENHVYDKHQRKALEDHLYETHKDAVDAVIRDDDLALPGSSEPRESTRVDWVYNQLSRYTYTVFYDDASKLPSQVVDDMRSLIGRIRGDKPQM